MPTQEPRVMSKEITIGEKTFELRKMPPWTAMYIAKLVASKCIPLIALLDIAPDEKQDGEEGEANLDIGVVVNNLIANAPTILDAITEDDLQILITRCLGYVNATYLKVKRPVYEDNYFTDREVEGDFPTCLRLVFEEVVFNCTSFFDENGSILEKIKAVITSQQQQ